MKVEIYHKEKNPVTPNVGNHLKPQGPAGKIIKAGNHRTYSLQPTTGVSNISSTLRINTFSRVLSGTPAKFGQCISAVKNFGRGAWNWVTGTQEGNSAQLTGFVALESSSEKLEPRAVKISDMATVSDFHSVLTAKITGSNSLCVVVKDNGPKVERTLIHVHGGRMQNGVGPVYAEKVNDLVMSLKERDSAVRNVLWIVSEDELKTGIGKQLSQSIIVSDGKSVANENIPLKLAEIRPKIAFAKEIMVSADGQVMDEKGNVLS